MLDKIILWVSIVALLAMYGMLMDPCACHDVGPSLHLGCKPCLGDQNRMDYYTEKGCDCSMAYERNKRRCLAIVAKNPRAPQEAWDAAIEYQRRPWILC